MCKSGSALAVATVVAFAFASAALGVNGPRPDPAPAAGTAPRPDPAPAARPAPAPAVSPPPPPVYHPPVYQAPVYRPTTPAPAPAAAAKKAKPAKAKNRAPFRGNKLPAIRHAEAKPAAARRAAKPEQKVRPKPRPILVTSPVSKKVASSARAVASLGSPQGGSAVALWILFGAVAAGALMIAGASLPRKTYATSSLLRPIADRRVDLALTGVTLAGCVLLLFALFGRG